MAQNNQELSAKIADKGGRLTPLALQGKLDEWKRQHVQKLVALSGDHAAADKVFTVCMSVITKNPMLLDCTFESLGSCILQSFQLGLFPGVFKECAYVPLKNGKTGNLEANFWPEYFGLVKLAVEAGAKCVTTRVVHEGDLFHFHEGLRPPAYAPACTLGADQGKRRFAYAAVCNSQNMWQVEVCSIKQIEATKARSRGATRSDSPWNSKYDDDVNWMWRKTALIQCLKLIPKNMKLNEALELDNVIDGEVVRESQSIVPQAAGLFGLPSPEDRDSIDITGAREGEKVSSQTGNEKNQSMSSSS